MHPAMQSQTVAPQRQPYVEAQICRLNESLSSFIQHIEELNKRLCPVLRSEPPATTDGALRGIAASCPLAERLSQMADQSDAAIARVQEILGRLEV